MHHILSTRAPAFRAGGLDRPGIGVPELIDRMAADPTLIWVPIVVVDGIVLVGFEGGVPAPFPEARAPGGTR